ncbi:MAG: GDP-mannose 4,6-dehydratase [Bacteroidetes bacterium]|nr:GDP-mannose 4,6-dehydratase [Bacteroidota bacterium]
MNFLVTGCAGFIGSHITEHLLSEGYRVTGIDNFDNYYSPRIKRQNTGKVQNHKNFQLVEGDIRNEADVSRLFSKNKFDQVIHIAARTGVRPSLTNPRLYYDVNVNGTLTLLESMKNTGITKMIFASSSSVYGNNKKIPFSESDPVDFPISPYAASKKACELLCHTYHHLCGFDIFCLRFFTVYGPRQRPEMAIHNFARNIMDNKPITLYGDGSSRRDYTYIGDIVRGLAGAVRNLKGYEIINLGESRTVSLSELIRLLEKSTGKKAIIDRQPQQPGDVEITNADISKARRLLQYDPITPIEKGIEKFIEWLVTEEEPVFNR